MCGGGGENELKGIVFFFFGKVLGFFDYLFCFWGRVFSRRIFGGGGFKEDEMLRGIFNEGFGNLKIYILNWASKVLSAMRAPIISTSLGH